MAKLALELHLTLEAGREAEAAQFLRQQVQGPRWRILAQLAAEIVREHENVTGGTVVLVTGADNAERVLADLAKADTGR